MNKLNSFRQRQFALGRRACGRPCRRALQTICLHKALRTPSAGPITAPADVVYECLTLLRRPDLDSLAPFFPAGSYDPGVSRVGLVVGGEVVQEAGPLACCHGFLDTAARRVLPGHLLRRCRVLSSVQLPGGTCQLRVALTARTGEEAVFLWRLRRLSDSEAQASQEQPGTHAQPQPHAADEARGSQAADAPDKPVEAGTGAAPGPGPERALDWAGPSASSLSGSDGEYEDDDNGGRAAAGTRGQRGAMEGTSAARPSGAALSEPSPLLKAAVAGGFQSGSVPRGGGDATGAAAAAGAPDVRQEQPGGATTLWVVESIRRDDSHDEEEMPAPGPMGRGPHPRCSPEQVVKAQLAALRRGDVAGAASYNVWSRSTSGGWELHLAAFRSMLRHPSYHVLLTSYEGELGPSALPSMRRMVQEVRLLTSALGGGLYGSGGGGGGGGGSAAMVFQLCMQANGCWLVEGIRPVP